MRMQRNVDSALLSQTGGWALLHECFVVLPLHYHNSLLESFVTYSLASRLCAFQCGLAADGKDGCDWCRRNPSIFWFQNTRRVTFCASPSACSTIRWVCTFLFCVKRKSNIFYRALLQVLASEGRTEIERPSTDICEEGTAKLTEGTEVGNAVHWFR